MMIGVVVVVVVDLFPAGSVRKQENTAAAETNSTRKYQSELADES